MVLKRAVIFKMYSGIRLQVLHLHVKWSNFDMFDNTGVVFWGFPRAESSPSAHLRMRDHERNGWYLSLIFWEFPPQAHSSPPVMLSVHTSPHAFSCAESSPLARIYIPPALAKIYIPPAYWPQYRMYNI